MAWSSTIAGALIVANCSSPLLVSDNLIKPLIPIHVDPLCAEKFGAAKGRQKVKPDGGANIDIAF
jgi:hypothetical protein